MFSLPCASFDGGIAKQNIFMSKTFDFATIDSLNAFYATLQISSSQVVFKLHEKAKLFIHSCLIRPCFAFWIDHRDDIRKLAKLRKRAIALCWCVLYWYTRLNKYQNVVDVLHLSLNL